MPVEQRPPDDDALVWLARAPLQAADDLARLVGRRAGRRLRTLATGPAPAIGSIALPGRGGPVAYYYLTAGGVARAALTLRTDAGALTAAAGLGQRALQRRLIRIDHLAVSRSVLIDLALDAAARGGVADWRPWPVGWRNPRSGARSAPPPAILDGDVALALGDGARYRAALLWDGGAATPEHLRARLAALARLTLDAGLPPVLLVTADPWRLPAALPPAVLWCTTTELSVAAPLDARWHGVRLPRRGLPLARALDALGPYARRGRPGTVPAVAGPPPPAGAPLTPTVERPVPRPLQHAVLPTMLEQVAWTLLAVVAAVPFITARQVERAHALPAEVVARHLTALADQGLLAPPAYLAGGAEPHHTASVAGIAALARRVGVRPAEYGALYRGDAGDAPAGRLASLRRHLAHTHGVNEVYVYLTRAARAAALPLTWYGEQRAWLRLDGRNTYLKPDARGVLGTHPRASFFVEYERGTVRAADDLRTKFATYYAYRRAQGLAHLRILAIAPAPCVERLLAAGRAAAPLAERADGDWLDLRVTTPEALACGRLDRAIWRIAGRPEVLPLLGRGGFVPLAGGIPAADRW